MYYTVSRAFEKLSTRIRLQGRPRSRVAAKARHGPSSKSRPPLNNKQRSQSCWTVLRSSGPCEGYTANCCSPVSRISSRSLTRSFKYKGEHANSRCKRILSWSDTCKMQKLGCDRRTHARVVLAPFHESTRQQFRQELTFAVPAVCLWLPKNEILQTLCGSGASEPSGPYPNFR